jgi:hypothetical protein
MIQAATHNKAGARDEILILSKTVNTTALDLERLIQR